MNPNNVDSRAFKRAVGKVLDAIETLEAGDPATDDSNIRFV